MKGKIRIRKDLQKNAVYVVNNLIFISEVDAFNIKERQEMTRQLRKQKRIQDKSS